MEGEAQPATDRTAAIGVLVALVAAGCAVLAAFLPFASFEGTDIDDNQLIAAWEGWVLVALGVVAAALVVIAMSKGDSMPWAWGLIVVGLGMLGLAIYSALGPRLDLAYAGPPSDEFSLEEQLELLSTTYRASPGIGIWLAGAAGVAIAVGGALAAGFRFGIPAGKRCPECAERVRMDASVCKHCGHRFAEAA